MNTSVNEWNELYRALSARQLPWESGAPSPTLVRLVQDRTIHGRVLDLGCGLGTHSIWMATEGLSIVGVDVSEAAIRQAEHRGRTAGVTVAWLVADGKNLPFDNNSFNAVFDRGTYHHQGIDKERYVREVMRVLKPGGYYLLLAFHPSMHWPKSVREDEVRRMFEPAGEVVWQGEETHLQPDGIRVRLLAVLIRKHHA
ncbi:MAG: class I SAM-dependent methyltransferase [Candidatus Kerfeldbacteria bacterium]|nr:class I SAM-dependent methyltransferase [Candidatus Kerfeldbacteria bacterium]